VFVQFYFGLIVIRSDQRSEPTNFYAPFRSLMWRYQFLSKNVRSLIWICHCVCANRFSRRHSHYCYT